MFQKKLTKKWPLFTTKVSELDVCIMWGNTDRRTQPWPTQLLFGAASSTPLIRTTLPWTHHETY